MRVSPENTFHPPPHPLPLREGEGGGVIFILLCDGHRHKGFTKKDVCEPVGLEYLDYAVGNCPIPFVAIGGIKEDNIAVVAGRGALLICAVTEILKKESNDTSHSSLNNSGAIFYMVIANDLEWSCSVNAPQILTVILTG